MSSQKGLEYAITLIRFFDKTLLAVICKIISIFLITKVPPKNPKTICFVKLWALGDSVITLALIKQVHSRYPKSEITVIATKRNSTIYENQKFIKNLIILDFSTALSRELWKQYDVVFDLEPYLNFSALLSKSIGKYIIGFSNQPRSGLYDYGVPFAKNRHVLDIYLDMGKVLKINRASKLTPILISPKDTQKTQKFIEKNKLNNKSLVGICPGAAESSRQRMWPPDRFAILADLIITNKNANVIFIGSPNELELIKEIQSKMKYKSSTTAGKLNLSQTISLIDKCNLFISNDTGPMHIAAAQGCKVIGLFGPNTPKRWGPFGKGNISLYHKLYCSPCIINEKGIMPSCIHKNFQQCMKKISVNEVETSVNKIL